MATHSVFWPGEFHGLCSPWDHKDSDKSEQLSLLYTYDEYYSVLQGKKILTHVTLWMNLEDIMLSETSQSQKGKFYMVLFI